MECIFSDNSNYSEETQNKLKQVMLASEQEQTDISYECIQFIGTGNSNWACVRLLRSVTTGLMGVFDADGVKNTHEEWSAQERDAQNAALESLLRYLLTEHVSLHDFWQYYHSKCRNAANSIKTVYN